VVSIRKTPSNRDDATSEMAFLAYLLAHSVPTAFSSGWTGSACGGQDNHSRHPVGEADPVHPDESRDHAECLS
jgi:hypothetical protein